MPTDSERFSCDEFAEVLAIHVLHQINESREEHPNIELRLFAKSVNSNVDTETLDNEILFFLSFIVSQVCSVRINDRTYLDELVPRFYYLVASE